MEFNMGRKIRLITFLRVSALFAMLAFSGLASAKSVYVLPDVNTSPARLEAYNVNPDGTLTFQTTQDLPTGGGTVGLGIDTTSKKLFVTQEGSGAFTIVDATTMAVLGTEVAAGASNLAGIVVDQATNRVYTVDRSTANLYVYDWNAATNTLTPVAGQAPVALAGATGIYGLALDSINNVLYIADYDGNQVRGYSTGALGGASVTNFAVAHPPVGIAVDAPSGFVYTVTPTAGCSTASSPLQLLSKYDLATSTETATNMGHGGAGVAVDPATGLVYVTAACSVDDLSVWNTTAATFVQTYTTGNIGNPVGLVVPEIEVSYRTPAIPTLSEWAMILLIMLLMTVGLVKARRRS
jgi:DNA-binding beta-propeller fold protein YncE